jgi:hypothetical protein
VIGQTLKAACFGVKFGLRSYRHPGSALPKEGIGVAQPHDGPFNLVIHDLRAYALSGWQPSV